MKLARHTTVRIEDIRRTEVGLSILDELHDQLRPQNGGERKLPTLLLYDEKGLKLFEDISFLGEYYLTNAEIEILQQHATIIASLIPRGCVILELGSGNLRKVEILLNAVELAKKRVDYYALDLSEPELTRCLAAVPEHYQYVRCHGLLGTYDDGLDWLKRPERQQQPKWILSLGSSIGNFGREEAAAFLQSFAYAISSHDAILVGLDACQDSDKIYRAYNDKDGKTHEFVLNGLRHANSLLGKDVFQLGDWEVIGEYDKVAGRHQAFYSPNKDVIVDGIHVETGAKIRVEESYKYSSTQSNELWRKAGVMEQACFRNSTDDYYLHLLAKPTLGWSLKPDEYAAQPVPSFDEFKQLWAAWDLVTRGMIPEEELLSKPIKLRNCCVFYLGHIPTFLDIHLTRATGEAPTEPRSYQSIFERGIDPDVDNPEQCHAHSEIPNEWPPVTEILDYQARVRSRVKVLFDKGQAITSTKVARALWLAFEHEETLLYMLVQSDRTLPPPGPIPDFERLAQDAHKSAVPNAWIKVPGAEIETGLDDPEDDHALAHYFSWDNEKPRRKVQVPAFEATARPLTNEDFVRYLCATGRHSVPASWTQTNDEVEGSKATKHSGGETVEAYLNGHSEPAERTFLKGKSVKTVYGHVALEYALTWPVFASYDELAGCAKWMGGRIPTADEVRSIYNYVDQLKTEEAERVLAKKISAVNGYICSTSGIQRFLTFIS
ncbi:MAG: hypothetical protein Q9201_000884 [Fulgogasparrea decipioides]